MIRTPLRLFLFAVAVMFAGVLLTRADPGSLVAPEAAHAGVAGASQPVPMGNGWTFQGCWRAEPHLQCIDVYTDSSGNYWICKPCGTTGNPSPGKCTQVSPELIETGLWCS